MISIIPGLIGMTVWLVVFMVLLAIAIYLYTAIALMTIAKKTKTKNGWLAFIPIANIYLMTQIAKLNGLWTLVVLLPIIPILGSWALAVAVVYFWWLIAERLKRPGWWGILMIVPVVNWVILGIMAWAKK